MRALEPRVLLDAAAVETAIDVAGQAAHSQLADDYMANSRPANELAPDNLKENVTSSDTEESETTEPTAARRTDREIVFIDASVEDHESLIASLEPGANVVILDSDRDGLTQIAEAMVSEQQYDAIHIFSHGTAGQLQLGDSVLNAATMTGSYKQILSDIGGKLSEQADILVYGCNFGQGAQGEQAAYLLASATGADIAASDDLTGSESLAGDWDLELSIGALEAQSYTMPQWDGILAGYDLQPNVDPLLGHSGGGIIGTVGTQATWSNAAQFDPGGGAPIEVYDIRATVIGKSGEASATFETVSTSNPTMDDFRVVVTNVGEVEGTVAGQDVLERGSVTVLWEVLVAGTTTRAPVQDINITISDLDGLAGQPDTIEGVGIGLANLNSYTLDDNTNLVETVNGFSVEFDGTQTGNNDPRSQVSAYWADANQFILVYSSHVQTAEFTMDGDGDATFVTPSTENPTQFLDLDSDDSNAIGDDFSVTYLDGLPAGPVNDSPVILGDVDLTIYDIDSAMLQNVTVTLTNAFAGDVLGYDAAVLSDLNINVVVDTSVAGEITLNLTGPALVSNFETALKTVSYQNTDAIFNKVDDRIVTFEISDGIISTSGAQTVISFGTVSAFPVASPNVYVQDEDTTLTANTATGLLANDLDAQSDPITIVNARDSSGAPIVPLGSPHTTPNGAIFTLNSDGSFTYIPAAHYSGAEYIEYTISDGIFQTTSWATFDIQPVVDTADIQLNLADPTSNEDDPSNPLSISVFSPDSSETQEVTAINIPIGVTLTDGVNSFTSAEDDDAVEVTDWDLSQIRILPIQNTDQDVVIQFTGTTIEADGSSNSDTKSITFEIDAVADSPNVLIPLVSGPIDADVDIGSALDIELFDTDGSEEITQIRLSNLPAGGQILLNGAMVPTPGNAIDLQLADLADLVFRPPQTAVNSIYNLEVTITVEETNVENGVAVPVFVRGPIALVVDLNNNDDPVIARDDSYNTAAGIPVSLNVLANDSIPDGGGTVTQINGVAISVGNPITLPGGEGVISKSGAGGIIFTPSDNFSGAAIFNYTAQDSDGSTDIGDVQVVVLPAWNLTGGSNATEGGDATYQITLNGALSSGQTAMADLSLINGSATLLDHTELQSAVEASIDVNADFGFSYDGTTLSYSAPVRNYDATYDATGSTYAANDISASGFDLGLGDDGITSRPLGFEFDFYGITVDTVYISANGYVTFGSPVDMPVNQALDGNAFEGRPAIAALWDNLRAGSGAVLYEASLDSFGGEQAIIQWQNVEHESGGGGTANFQMIISKTDGSVRINYDDVGLGGSFSDGASATIGVQGLGGMANQYLLNGSAPLDSGSSIVFQSQTTNSPTLVLDLPITNDSHFEPDETFRIILSSPTDSMVGTGDVETTIDTNDNTNPDANDDAISTGEVTPAVFNVITDAPGTDTDFEGHSLTVTELNGAAVTDGQVVNLASGAQLTVFSNGSMTFDQMGVYDGLLVGQTATENLTYTVDDGFGGTSTANLVITINGENRVPVLDLEDDGTNPTRNNSITMQPNDPLTAVAAPDAFVSDEDDSSFSSLQIDMGGFLQSGEEVVDILGQQFVFGTLRNASVTVGGVSHNIVYNGAGQIFITVPAGEITTANMQELIRGVGYQNTSGADVAGARTLTFHVNDGDDIATATSNILVVGLNLAPVAQDDGTPSPFTLVEDSSITIQPSVLLANDSDPDGDPIQISSVQNAVNGTVVINGSGEIVFTPDANFFGSTSFEYTLDDGKFGTDTGTVFLVVTGTPDAPIVDLNGAAGGADHTVVYTENDAPVSITAVDMSIQDLDLANIDSASIVVSGGRIGDVFSVGTLPGGIQATTVPSSASSGMTSDGPVTITLTNTASATNYEAAIRSISFSSTSETPVETDRVISVSVVSNSLTSNIAESRISVVAVNDVPNAVDDNTFTVNEDTTLVITPAMILVNDTDLDGDTLTITNVTNASIGTVSINGSGNVEFVPPANYSGLASFDYEISDGNGGVDTGTVNFTVLEVNDVPIVDINGTDPGRDFATSYTENASPIPVVDTDLVLWDADDTTLEGAQIVLTNGRAGDQLQAPANVGPIGITVVPGSPLSGSGTITVTFTGTGTTSEYEAAMLAVSYLSTSESPSTIARTLEVTANDGEADSIVRTTTISVISVNDVPVANDDGSFNANEDETLVLGLASLVGNDSDLDGDALTISNVSGAVNGTVSINGAGDVEFLSDSEYSGPASFNYTVTDGNGGSDTANVTINVLAVNDAPFVDVNGTDPGRNFATSFVENGASIPVVDSDLVLWDVDDTMLEGAQIVLTNGFAGDQLQAPANVGPISISVVPSAVLSGPGPITVTFFGTGTTSEYEAAMLAVGYLSTSESPSEVDRVLEITANDGDADSIVRTTTISVTSVNDVPIANDDGTFNANEDEMLVLGLASLVGNDTDLDGDTLTISNVTNAVNGTVSINAAGDVEFVPAYEYSGPASFDYTVTDGNGGSDTASVTINVLIVNDAPRVDLNGPGAGNDYSTSYTENAAGVSIIGTAPWVGDVDDTFIEGASVVLNNGQVGDILEAPANVGPVTISVSPSGALTSTGSMTVTLTGTATKNQYEAALQAITYRSTSDAPSAVDRDVSVTVNDGELDSLVATTTITVVPVNDVPVANDDGSFNANEDETLVLGLASLVGNDVDLDGDALTISNVNSAVNGTVSINAAGGVEFVPDPEYSGPASFIYTISDGNGGFDTANVTIDVLPVNDAPRVDLNGPGAGNDYSASYTENDAGVSIIGAAPWVGDVDDTFIEGASVILNNGQIGDVLEAPANVGPVTISVSPSGALTSTGSVTVTLTGTATKNQYEAALQAVTYRSVSDAPSAIDRDISVRVNDGELNSAIATTTVTVTPVNDIPVANDDGTFNATEDTTVILNAASLVSNDMDLDGDTLSISNVTNPVNGTVSINAAGNVRFVPDNNFFGIASFEYTVIDGNGGADTASVTINVLPVNDAPNLDLGGPSVPGSDYATSYTENAPGVSIISTDAWFGDVDDVNLEGASAVLNNGQTGDILEAPASVGPVNINISPTGALTSNGSITVTLSGTATKNQYEAALQAVTYRSISEAPSAVDRDISVTINDGDLNSVVATTTIAVVPVNDAPVAADDLGLTMQEDGTLTISPMTNDSDVEGDAISIVQIAGQPVAPGGSVLFVHGQADLSSNGQEITFTPVPDFSGPVSIEYTISDGSLTDSATISIDVIGVNDAPVAVDDGPVTLAEDTSVRFDPISGSDTDVENDPLNVVAINGTSIAVGMSVAVANGTVELDADGRTLVFTPAQDFNGTTSIDYTISDGALTSEAEIVFEVTPVNDAVVSVSTPMDLNLEDGQNVSLPMAQHFNDVDGDAMQFSASGLPAGLAIDASSGVISGVIDSSASQTSPYSVTIRSTDGLSAAASVNFSMDISNPPPVGSANTTSLLNEGDTIAEDMSVLFNDPDGDVLTFSATGLPSWATINSLTGVVSGTVPGDAEQFGPVTFTAHANDGEGGAASSVVTFDPRNVAPVVIDPAADALLLEDQAFALDVRNHFADGGSDTDVLSFTVSGLPDGISFDPGTGLISGTTAEGSSSPEPYEIVMTADDGQGGTVQDIFRMHIGDFSSPEEVDLPFDDADDSSDDNTLDTDTGGDGETTSGIGDVDSLSGTTVLDGESGILLGAVSGADPLFGSPTSGVDGGIRIGDISSIDQSGGWMNSEGRSGSDDWMFDGVEADPLSVRAMIDKIAVETYWKGEGFFILVKSTFPQTLELRVEGTRVTMLNGVDLPDWMKLIRDGFISANPPKGFDTIDLEITTMLADGRELVKQVRVDIKSATVQPLEQELRGSLDTDVKAGDKNSNKEQAEKRTDL